MDFDMILFFGFIGLCVGTFIYHTWKAEKTNHLSTWRAKKLILERVALKNKYRDKVPAYNEDGTPYLEYQQARDRVGVYSKEYHEEYKKISEKYRQRPLV